MKQAGYFEEASVGSADIIPVSNITKTVCSLLKNERKLYGDTLKRGPKENGYIQGPDFWTPLCQSSAQLLLHLKWDTMYKNGCNSLKVPMLFLNH